MLTALHVYFILVYISLRTKVVVFELELLKVGGVIQSVDEGQFVNYLLSFSVCQRIAMCNNMDRRIPDLYRETIFIQNNKV